MNKGACLKRVLVVTVALTVLLVVGLVVLVKSQSKPLPTGQIGPEADRMAREMMAAINHDAWLKTGAVRWDFDGRQQHLWDLDRHLARVCWKDFEVLIDLNNRQGKVYRNGVLVEKDATQYLKQAWAHWANDSFWLNPVSKLFDDGVSRAVVHLQNGQRGLLATYQSGGVTPGDSYLWTLGDNGLPVRWEMWVSIIPVGGLAASWEEWTPLNTGVRVSRKHDLGIFVLDIINPEAATTLAELEGDKDPFAPLFQ